jgi:peptide chain release factor 3
MQFEVAVERMRTEFGAEVSTQPLPWTAARRTDADGAAKVLADLGQTDVYVRADGTQLAVFANRFALERFAAANPSVRLERLIGADEPA